VVLAKAPVGKPPVARFVLGCIFKHRRQKDVSATGGSERIGPAG
jgi:hypothetical protein